MQRTTSRKAREEFVFLMVEHVPTPQAQEDSRLTFARKLMRYGATLGRIAENQCNGYHKPDQFYKGQPSHFAWDEDAAAADEKKEARIRLKVTNLCTRFGCKPLFSGDPRGNVLKIAVPDGFTNDWGREGICVPTS